MCSEILAEKEELAILDYSDTFFECEGRTYQHTFVSSGYCPQCFDRLVNEAIILHQEQPAA